MLLPKVPTSVGQTRDDESSASSATKRSDARAHAGKDCEPFGVPDNFRRDTLENLLLLLLAWRNEALGPIASPPPSSAEDAPDAVFSSTVSSFASTEWVCCIRILTVCR